MCPDHGLLSAFADGEVPSPWKERISEHLAGCAACEAVVEGFAALGARMRAGAVPGEEAILARGRDRLEQELAARAAAAEAAPSFAPARRRGRAWERRLSLPLPVAAAAAMAMLLLAGLAAANLVASNRAAKPVLATAEVLPNGAEQVSMDRILRYLDNQNAQVTLTINLPQEATFGETGTPVIVRAPKARDGGATP